MRGSKKSPIMSDGQGLIERIASSRPNARSKPTQAYP